ncbi:MAG: 50S ribosomal protein L23 [Patescibacteria group bacterium]
MGIFKRKKEDKDKDAKSAGEKKGVSMKDLYSSDKESQSKKEEKKAPETAPKSDQKEKAKSSKGSSKKTPRIAYRTILKPLMTEKVNDLGVENKYVFQVAVDTNKIEVAKAVKETYNVTPEKVNIINMKGKSVRFGRMRGKRSDWKKAVVKLPKGKSISIHEGV